MSIAVLNQVYDEARRLAVAGSVVAKGDFRLKKLIPPLEQAGSKAPVFAKVAEAATKVVDGPEDSSAESLLELASLTTAVLYTQGETGMAGELQPIETTNLGGETAQTSARLLKPLLEALSSTGSGRLELVKEAHEHGAFRDLRLVMPALKGLDDPYAEIADFLAEKVLPMYGRAILPELSRTYDSKGTKSHPRRLKLMHALDPSGTREFVQQALEGGSKEVRVAAIACLGSEPEDLQYLIEQAGAKAQDVREAAYRALSTIDKPEAVAVLEKGLVGRDLEVAANAIKQSKLDRLTLVLVAEIQMGTASLVKLKDKKEAGTQSMRLVRLIHLLAAGQHAEVDRLLRNLFARRAELAKVKGANFGGSDVVEAVIHSMAAGPKTLQEILAHNHADLEAGDLASAFEAARAALPAAEVYDQFAPYVQSDKTKGADKAKRDAVIAALGGDYIAWHHRNDGGLLDPRWLDLAVKIKHHGLVNAFGRPGHKGAEDFLQTEFDAIFKKGRDHTAIQQVLTAMTRLRHPRAADALIATFEKEIGKPNSYAYWYYHLIPELPKSALPPLEALAPRLQGRDADRFLDAIEELRNKRD
jgi:hypothetical protein